MSTTRQRSRNGCLTCRRKRKKCDELRPQCSRCAQVGDQCVWPHPSTCGSDFLEESRERTLFEESPAASSHGLNTTNHFHSPYSNVSTSTYATVPNLDARSQPCSCSETLNTHTFAISSPGPGLVASASASTLNSKPTPTQTGPISDTDNRVSLRQNSFPPVSSVARNDSSELDAWRYIGSNIYAGRWLDQHGDEDEYENQEWLSDTQRSLVFSLKELDQCYTWEICNSFILFVGRYCFSPSEAFNYFTSDMFQRYSTSASVKHAMLSTVTLIRGYCDPNITPALMFQQAETFATTAHNLALLDTHRSDVPLGVKLSVLMELLCYYYFSGKLDDYYWYLQKAGPIITELSGSVVDFHKLSGSKTFDVRFFSWCDILGAMALSRPTMLTYACDVDPLLQANLEGRDKVKADVGIEWLVGCPDAFTMLMVQIVNLRQSRVSQTERATRAARIEEIARAWVIRPIHASTPLLRVERMAAQEVWRHTIILYLYYAIHKASPDNEVVQKSVKQIISLASTLRSGHNPDCLLPVPYFIAATFAITPKHRHLLRTRLVKMGNEAYLAGLVGTLDELWRQVGDTGRRVDWSEKYPPTFVF